MEPVSVATFFDAPWGPAALTLADCALKGAVLLAAAWLVTLLMRRASAAARHLVWALALAGLLALPALGPLLPKWRLPLPAQATPATPAAPAPPAPETIITPPSAPEPVPAPVGPADPTGFTPPASPRLTRTDPAPGTAQPPHAEPSRPAAPPAKPRHAWLSPFILLSFWLAGALLTLSPLLLGLALVARLRRRARPLCADPAWAALLAELTRALGIEHDKPLRIWKFRIPRSAFRIRLLLSPAATMPMAAGLLRPAVLLPAEAEGWDDEKRRVVLLHELAHIRRRDCLTHTVARAALALHWFNPLAWLALARLRAERERACDDLVLTAGQRPSAYAGHLLQIARATRTGALAGAAAITMARPSQLEGRLLAILDATRNRRGLTRRVIVFGLFILLALLVPLGVFTLREPPAEPQPQPPELVGLAWQSHDDLEWNFNHANSNDRRTLRTWRPDGRDSSLAELEIPGNAFNTLRVNELNQPQIRHLIVALSFGPLRPEWSDVKIGNPAVTFTEGGFIDAGTSMQNTHWWQIHNYQVPTTLTLPRDLELTVRYSEGKVKDHGAAPSRLNVTTDLGDGLSVRVIEEKNSRTPYFVEVTDTKGADQRACQVKFTPTLLGRWQRSEYAFGESYSYRPAPGKRVWKVSTPMPPDKIKSIRVLTSPIREARFKTRLLPFERTPRPEDAHAATFVTASGVKARLLGISNDLPQSKEFWAPDGTPLPQAPLGFAHPDNGRWGTPDNQNQICRNLYLEIEQSTPVESIDICCEIPGISSRPDGNHENTRRFMSINRRFELPAGMQESPVRVGIATGPWVTLASVGPEGGRQSFMRQGRQETIVFGKAAQAGNDVIMTVDKNIFEMVPKGPALQCVAIDKTGKRHRNNGGPSAGGLYTLHFSDLKLDQLDRVEYQARNYEWHEIKGVKLNPAPKPSVPPGLSLKLTAHTLYEAGEDPAVYLEMPQSNWRVDDSPYHQMDAEWPMFLKINGKEIQARTFLTAPGSGQNLHLINDSWYRDQTGGQTVLPPGKYRVSYVYRPFRALPNTPAGDLAPGGTPVDVIGLESNEVEFEVVKRLPEGYFNGELQPGWEETLRRSIKIAFTDDRNKQYLAGTLLCMSIEPFPFNTAFQVYAEREGNPERFPVTELALKADRKVTWVISVQPKEMTWENVRQWRWRLILEPSAEVARRNPPVRSYYGKTFTTDWLTFEASPSFEENRAAERLFRAGMRRGGGAMTINFNKPLDLDDENHGWLKLRGNAVWPLPPGFDLGWDPNQGALRIDPQSAVRLLPLPGARDAWEAFMQLRARAGELSESKATSMAGAPGQAAFAGILSSERNTSIVRTVKSANTHATYSQWHIEPAMLQLPPLPAAAKAAYTSGPVSIQFLPPTSPQWGVHDFHGLYDAGGLGRTFLKDGKYGFEMQSALKNVFAELGGETTADPATRTPEFYVERLTTEERRLDETIVALRWECPADMPLPQRCRALAEALGMRVIVTSTNSGAVKNGRRGLALRLVPQISAANTGGKGAAAPTSSTLGSQNSMTTPTARFQIRLAAKPDERSQAEQLPWFDPRRKDEPLWVSKQVHFSEKTVAESSLTADPINNQPMITLVFDQEARARFAELTGRNIRRQLAFVFDGKVIAAPTIMTKIPDGKLTIGAGLSRQQGEAIVTAIGAARAGTKPGRAVTNEPAFGPLVERALNMTGENAFIDFDSGKTYSAADCPLALAEAEAWAARNGIDAGCGNPANTRGLIGMNMIAVPMTVRPFERIAPRELIENPYLATGKPGSSTFITAGATLPATFEFKTREGGLGVLQIVQVREREPRGVTIRYRMMIPPDGTRSLIKMSQGQEKK